MENKAWVPSQVQRVLGKSAARRRKTDFSMIDIRCGQEKKERGGADVRGLEGVVRGLVKLVE